MKLRLSIIVAILCFTVVTGVLHKLNFLASNGGPYYRDIDYFSLTGVDPLTSDQLQQFPYYKIVDLPDDKREVTFIKGLPDAEIFEKRKDYWCSVNERKSFAHHILDYEFILKDRRLRLVYAFIIPAFNSTEKIERYLDSTDFIQQQHFLFKIEITTLGGKTEYILDTAEKIFPSPSPDVEKRLNEFKYQSVYTTQFDIKGDVLVVRAAANSDRCHSLKDEWGNKRNLFYYLFFNSRPVQCP